MNKKVISLELAKRIHKVAEEKGVELPTPSCYWDSHARLKNEEGYGITEDGEFSAYDCQELGEMLPDWTSQAKGGGRWEVSIMKSFFKFNKGGGTYEDSLFIDDSEVEARGKMYLYLLENDYIK